MADVGRPSKYSDYLALLICEQIVEGKSLRTICQADDMPSIPTVFAWLDKYPEFLNRYARAKDQSADTLTEDIHKLAWAAVNGEIDPQAARVAIDAFKWTASKLKPKKYGDKLDLTTAGKELPTPIYAGLSQTPKEVPAKGTKA